MRLKAGWHKVLLCVLLMLASIPYVEGLQLQQLSVLEAFFLAAAVYALIKEKFVVAGLLLACATIKPQLSVYFIGLYCFGVWDSGEPESGSRSVS